MPTTLITWYFYELWGLGGWVVFLLIALAAVFYIYYDSAKRNLSALGWRVGVLILMLLLIPSMLYRFSVTLDQFTDYVNCILGGNTPTECVNNFGAPPLAPYYEILFYLGLAGGLLALAVAVAYYINFQGMTGASSRPVAPPPPPPYVYAPPPAQPRRGYAPEAPAAAPPRPRKQLAHAWLVAQDGKSYQLCAGETTIGRSSENDIYLTGDTTLSKQHAKIVEQNDHFRLIDLGSTNGTRVNGRWLRQPILLEPDDEVQFGDHTLMRFVTTR
jgi:hypothetical protein